MKVDPICGTEDLPLIARRVLLEPPKAGYQFQISSVSPRTGRWFAAHLAYRNYWPLTEKQFCSVKSTRIRLRKWSLFDQSAFSFIQNRFENSEMNVSAQTSKWLGTQKPLTENSVLLKAQRYITQVISLQSVGFFFYLKSFPKDFETNMPAPDRHMTCSWYAKKNHWRRMQFLFT